VEPDVTFSVYEQNPTPPQPQGPQVVTRGERRIGELDSPTAKIDGVDERINIDVAVIDSGIQPDHPDLNVVGGYNCTSSKKGWADDWYHGTMVGGFVGALDNIIGAVGVAQARASGP
jgi:hypothetical protein